MKSCAEERYEDALADGDGAILLEQPEPGMYTMNIGNMLPGEQVSITLDYAELYAWQGDSLRYFLPLTIAPRYGDPEQAGFQAHQLPETDPLVEHRFRLTMQITGLLAGAELQSPSHRIQILRQKDATQVNLALGQAFMDRDFVLVFRTSQAEQQAALIEPDGAGSWTAMATFIPRIPETDRADPRNICIVVDCSGSMNGDSITQAREALRRIIDQLRPDDYFNILAFGSSTVCFFEGQVQADLNNAALAKRRLRSLAADMGGTGMLQALQTAIRLPGPDIPRDILLITDGEIWQSKEVIDCAKQAQSRVFTIGVGSSVSESLVRELANQTRGACELVAPREAMAEKILRHFKKIMQPAVHQIKIRWPTPPERDFNRRIGPVHDGETLHVFAGFRHKPSGPVSLKLFLSSGSSVEQSIKLPEREQTHPEKDRPGPIARMAVQQALVHESESMARTMALSYQLISPYTHLLVLEKRSEADKARGLPSLRKVPQMLAAGWHGTGSVRPQDVHEFEIPCYLRRDAGAESEAPARYQSIQGRADSRRQQQGPDLEIPAFIRRSFQSQETTSQTPERKNHDRPYEETSPEQFVQNVNTRHQVCLRPELQLLSFKDLLDCGLPERIVETLRNQAAQSDSEASEEGIVLAFLLSLLRSPLGPAFDRKTRWIITMTGKARQPNKQLIQVMTEAFTGLKGKEWG